MPLSPVCFLIYFADQDCLILKATIYRYLEFCVVSWLVLCLMKSYLSLPKTLSSLSLTQGAYLALPLFPFLASWLGSSLKSVSWENCRVLCFPIFLAVWGWRSWSPLLHVVYFLFDSFSKNKQSLFSIMARNRNYI